ncbi:hypothetical protein FACS189488_01060 [Betaproteobacteria bacterium]|nr:hypothetical protein FACS189488_01060 [Betaproteobacteria bacterium]
MGMDGVELVLAVEETFGIQITDEDACAIATPGDFADCVMRIVVRPDKNAPCFSQNRFYRIRSALVNALGIPRKRICPHTPLREIIRRDSTRADWQAFKLALNEKGLGLPELEHPWWFWCFFLAVQWFIPAAGAMAFAIMLGELNVTFPVLCLALMVLGVVMSNSIRGWMSDTIGGWRIPARLQTVASLIPSYSGAITPDEQTTVWTREAVLATIIRLTHEQLGVPIEEIKEHSYLIDDLGMD